MAAFLLWRRSGKIIWAIYSVESLDERKLISCHLNEILRVNFGWFTAKCDEFICGLVFEMWSVSIWWPRAPRFLIILSVFLLFCRFSFFRSIWNIIDFFRSVRVVFFEQYFYPPNRSPWFLTKRWLCVDDENRFAVKFSKAWIKLVVFFCDTANFRTTPATIQPILTSQPLSCAIRFGLLSGTSKI